MHQWLPVHFFDYGMDVVNHPGAVVPPALILMLLVPGTLVGLWRRPMVGFIGAWFFAILAPSSGVFPIILQTMAEHRMYLPLTAVVVLIVSGLRRLLGRRSFPVLLALTAVFGWLTHQRNETLLEIPGGVDGAGAQLNAGLRLQPEHDPARKILARIAAS
jgi:hypothetical protein